MRLTAAALLVSLLASSLMVRSASAAPSVVVDGQPLIAAVPLYREGRLLLPLRPTFEAVQAQVQWLPRELKIEARRGERLVELWVGTPVAQVDRAPLQLDVPPCLINGQTYVPLRLVVEAFGGRVRWDARTQTASIDTPQ